MAQFSLRCLIVVAFVVGMIGPMEAKGRTVKLTMTGGGLSAPIEVTDTAALVSVWDEGAAPGCGFAGSGFFGENVPEPAATLPRYEVAFHVRPPREQQVSVMYIVRYVFDPNTGEGFVYLPKAGEPNYSLNAGSISRPTKEGQWHRARPVWSGVLSSKLLPAS